MGEIFLYQSVGKLWSLEGILTSFLLAPMRWCDFYKHTSISTHKANLISEQLSFSPNVNFSGSFMLLDMSCVKRGLAESVWMKLHLRNVKVHLHILEKLQKQKYSNGRLGVQQTQPPRQSQGCRTKGTRLRLRL